ESDLQVAVIKECRLLVLYVFPSIVAGRRRVARLGTSRQTLIRMMGINKLCCEFATRLGSARSLHWLSLSTWIPASDAAVLHAGRRCREAGQPWLAAAAAWTQRSGCRA